MNKTQLGQSDLYVTKLCMGTMTFGEQNTKADSFKILDAAFDAGINFFDTAEIYPVQSRKETFGASETIVGEWLKTKPREQVVLASKITGPSRNFDWIRDNDLDFKAHNIELAVNNSLKRLDVDCIDLYQLHWPARNVPIFGSTRFNPKFEKASASIEETLIALDAQVKAGKIRHIGVSNESAWGVAEFTRQAERLGLSRIVSIQNAYNLLNRSYEYGLDETCYRENVSLLAYSPLAFGRLSGKYNLDPKATGRLTYFPPTWSPRYMRDSVIETTQLYMDVAQKHGISATALAIAWCTRQWFIASTIIGATNPAQLDEQIQAAALVLPEALVKDVEAIHARYPNPAW